MRSITLAQFHTERSKRAQDPIGGELELYRLEDDDQHVGELPILLVIPSPDPLACAPFVVHRMRDEDAVQKLIDLLTAALQDA